MQQIADEEGIDLSAMQLFYYEAYSLAYDDEANEWISFSADNSMLTDVEIPAKNYCKGLMLLIFLQELTPSVFP